MYCPMTYDAPAPFPSHKAIEKALRMIPMPMDDGTSLQDAVRSIVNKTAADDEIVKYKRRDTRIQNQRRRTIFLKVYPRRSERRPPRSTTQIWAGDF